MRILQLVHTSLQFEPPVFALGQALAKRGHQVICLGYWLPGLGRSEELFPGYTLVRIPRGDWSWLPRPARGALRISRFWTTARRFAEEFQPDVVIPMGYDVLPTATALASSGTRAVYYCTEYSSKPKLESYLTGWGFVKLLEKGYVQEMDVLVSVEPTRARLQAQDWGRETDYVILNAPLFDPEVDKMAQRQISDARHSVVRLVYAGSIDSRICLPELMRAVGSSNGVSLDIYGEILPDFSVPFHRELASTAKNSAGQVRYGGTIPYLQLPARLIGFDLGVSFYDDATVNTQLASPAKLFEYMRSGLALLCTAQPTPRRVVEETRSGYVVDAKDISALRRVLQDIVSDPGKLTEMRLNALSAFRKKYAYEQQAAGLIEWIETSRSSNGDGLRL